MPEKLWLDSAGDMNIDQLIQSADTHRIDSIVVALESALLRKSDLTSCERVVVVVEAMEREVNNGGFGQFFFNSSNQYAGQLVSSLLKINAPVTAQIAERAHTAIGGRPDWTSAQFEDAVTQLSETAEAELAACDKAYFTSGEAIEEKLFEFIKSNKAAIYLSAGSA